MPLPQLKIQAWIFNFKFRFLFSNLNFKNNESKERKDSNLKNKWAHINQNINGLTLLELPQLRFRTKNYRHNNNTLSFIFLLLFRFTLPIWNPCSFSWHCFLSLQKLAFTFLCILRSLFSPHRISWIKKLRTPFLCYFSLIAVRSDARSLSSFLSRILID